MNINQLSVGISSVLSLCGAVFVMITYVLGKRRHFILKLIVSLAVANLFTSVAYLMSFIKGWPSPAWCQIQAVLMVVFEDASILWTVAIALTLHQHTVARLKPERLEQWFHLVCWGLPATVALALLLLGLLGPADSEPHTTWCWIAAEQVDAHDTVYSGAALVTSVNSTSTSGARWVQLGVFYAPLVLAFGFNLVTYMQVGHAFSSMARVGAVDATSEHQIQLRLRLYLLVFLVVWTPGLIHRTAQALGYDPTWLQLAHTMSSCSMGSLNCLVYGCNEASLRPYKEAINRIGCSLLGIQLSFNRRARQMTRSMTRGAVDDTLLLDTADPRSASSITVGSGDA